MIKLSSHPKAGWPADFQCQKAVEKL